VKRTWQPVRHVCSARTSAELHVANFIYFYSVCWYRCSGYPRQIIILSATTKVIAYNNLSVTTLIYVVADKLFRRGTFSKDIFIINDNFLSLLMTDIFVVCRRLFSPIKPWVRLNRSESTRACRYTRRTSHDDLISDSLNLYYCMINATHSSISSHPFSLL
jgi:hypothetical protein